MKKWTDFGHSPGIETVDLDVFFTHFWHCQPPDTNGDSAFLDRFFSERKTKIFDGSSSGILVFRASFQNPPNRPTVVRRKKFWKFIFCRKTTQNRRWNRALIFLSRPPKMTDPRRAKNRIFWRPPKFFAVRPKRSRDSEKCGKRRK